MEAWIPLSIIACMLFGMIIIGKLAQRKVKNSDDYVVANRSTPLFLLVGTLFASFWGGGAVIGGSGAAYNEGVYGVIADPFAAGLSLILIGIFFVTILRNSKFKSLGELYRRRYGASVSYLASGLMIPTYLIWTAVQLLAISKVINVLFGIPTAVVTIVAALIVILFTYLGGMLAVIWTDSVQMIIILIGLCLILVFGVNYVGGIKTLVTYTPENFWNFLPQEQNTTSWLVYLSMWVGMGLGNIPSPDLAQRAFVAKDAKTAKRGFILSGLLYWVAGLIPILIALIG
ncbi:MAG: sodium:solute symporter family transporter, partial [Erysipelotrichaceae bacterium]